MTPEQEHKEEQASLYVAGALPPDEQRAFEIELRNDPRLRELTESLRRAVNLFALSFPPVPLPPTLKDKVMRRIDVLQGSDRSLPGARSSAMKSGSAPGFLFHGATDASGWKHLPIPGASLKLLSIDQERHYAVLLGKLGPGVKYPAHPHVGPEEIYILSGDLHIGDRSLGPGDFHHADAGTSHGVNFSVEGCTLIAVLPADHELVQFALG
jgi:anti-sigma factor ChrR (cupin superfamily)